jgi:hypothetical protein
MFSRINRNPASRAASPRADWRRGLACIAAVLCVAWAALVVRGAEPGVKTSIAETPAAPTRATTSDRAPGAAVPAKIYRYARRLVERYDRNGDGKLQKDEWRRMQGQPAHADADGDQVISLDELAQWIFAYGAQRRLRLAYPVMGWPESAATSVTSDNASGDKEVKPETSAPSASPEGAAPPGDAGPASGQADSKAARPEARFHVPAKRFPAGLPAWFLQRDADGDGQLTLSEFAPNATAADQQEFARYDLNGDGVITPQEYLKATKASKPAKQPKGVGP